MSPLPLQTIIYLPITIEIHRLIRFVLSFPPVYNICPLLGSTSICYFLFIITCDYVSCPFLSTRVISLIFPYASIDDRFDSNITYYL